MLEKRKQTKALSTALDAEAVGLQERIASAPDRGDQAVMGASVTGARNAVEGFCKGADRIDEPDWPWLRKFVDATLVRQDEHALRAALRVATHAYLRRMTALGWGAADSAFDHAPSTIGVEGEPERRVRELEPPGMSEMSGPGLSGKFADFQRESLNAVIEASTGTRPTGDADVPHVYWSEVLDKRLAGCRSGPRRTFQNARSPTLDLPRFGGQLSV